jgi:Beta galactosidase small chain
MKKPLPHALPLCFGLPLLALSLSFSMPHPHPGRTTLPALAATSRNLRSDFVAPATPSSLPLQNDTTPSATLQQKGGQITLSLYPTLLQEHYTNITLEWVTMVNGLPGQKGVVPHRNLSATGPTAIVLPIRVPPGNDEIGLQVVGRLAAAPGHKPTPPLFTTYLPLRPWTGDYSMPSAGELSFTDSNNIFTITSAKTQVQFDKQTGWLLHYEADDAVLMGDTAGLRTDLGPADTLQPRLQLFFASTGPQIVIVKAEYTLPEINCLLHLSYTLNAAGDMLVEQTLEKDTTAASPPEQTLPRPFPPTGTNLPRFGMGWMLPKELDSMSWYAADPPDMPGITPPVNLSREDVFTSVRWLTLKRPDGHGLRISADSNFLRWGLHQPDSLHSRGWTLGIYKTIYPATQRRFNYSYRVTPLACAPAPTPHPPAHPTTHPQTPTTHPQTPAKKQ